METTWREPPFFLTFHEIHAWDDICFGMFVLLWSCAEQRHTVAAVLCGAGRAFPFALNGPPGRAGAVVSAAPAPTSSGSEDLCLPAPFAAALCRTCVTAWALSTCPTPSHARVSSFGDTSATAGTGKTVTLVECALQIMQAYPHARLLLCAPQARPAARCAWLAPAPVPCTAAGWSNVCCIGRGAVAGAGAGIGSHTSWDPPGSNSNSTSVCIAVCVFGGIAELLGGPHVQRNGGRRHQAGANAEAERPAPAGLHGAFRCPLLTLAGRGFLRSCHARQPHVTSATPEQLSPASLPLLPPLYFFFSLAVRSASLPHFFLVLCFMLHAGERRCATLLLFFGAHPHVQPARGSEHTSRDCGHLRSGR